MASNVLRRMARRWPALGAARAAWRAAAHRLRHPLRLCDHPSPEQVAVSVVIPVKDAGPDLQPLLHRLREQQGFRAVEAVVVDSGSTDGSAERAESMGATVVRIAPSDFSHSYARNLGAERASGDYVLFTVQDALPSSERWLLAMYEGLRRHHAASVTCGEEPRPDSDLFYRAISWYHNRFMSPDGSDVVMEAPAGDDPMERRRNAQLSDTACLIGRTLFLRHRHRGDYAEDLDLGLRLSAEGHRLVFLAGTRVVHSHNRPAYYHLRRSYVEHLTLYRIVPGYPMIPGSPAEAVDDLTRSFAILGGLIHDGLPAREPWSTNELRSAVREAVDARGGLAAVVTGTGYVDDRTRAFVQRLAQDDRSTSPNSIAATPLTQAIPFVAGLICDYLDHVARPLMTLDDLEEFKAALYKGWALHCGVRLASAYWGSPDAVRDSLRAVHKELTAAV